MRPTYESAADRANQRAVADLLAALWCCEAGPCPKHYRVDYAMRRGQDVIALVEVKCRTYQRPTYWVSLHKWTELLALAETTGIPAFLAVHFAGHGLYVLPAVRRSWRVIYAGRTDRGDAQDVEPMVEIPIGAFDRVWSDAMSESAV